MLGLRIPPVIYWSAGGELYWYFLDCSSFKQTLVVSAVGGKIYAACHAHSAGTSIVRSERALFTSYNVPGSSCVRTWVPWKMSRSRRAQLLLLVKMALRESFSLAQSGPINLRHISVAHKWGCFFFGWCFLRLLWGSRNSRFTFFHSRVSCMAEIFIFRALNPTYSSYIQFFSSTEL